MAFDLIANHIQLISLVCQALTAPIMRRLMNLTLNGCHQLGDKHLFWQCAFKFNRVVDDNLWNPHHAVLCRQLGKFDDFNHIAANRIAF